MTILVGRNTRLEVQKTVSASQVISAISNANPAVVVHNGASPASGDYVILSDTLEGMEEVTGQVGRVANPSASPSSFELESVDSTGYGTFSGPSSFTKITAWSTLAQSTSLEAGSAGINKLDSTTLLNSRKKNILGQPDVPDLTVNFFSDPLLEASLIVAAAADAGSILAFRCTLQNGSKRLFRGYVTLPTESITVGQLITGSFTISQVGIRLAFAS
jgi:hypothetical protein